MRFLNELFSYFIVILLVCSNSLHDTFNFATDEQTNYILI